MDQRAFQDCFTLPGALTCWGCGRDNDQGLQIKSYWDGDEAVCTWKPQEYHLVGLKYLNGGIIVTIMDCHCTCAAMASAYRAEGREIGSDPPIAYVGGTINVSFLKPTPIDREVVLRARLKAAHPKKSIFTCDLLSGDEVCAAGEFTLVRVPSDWGE
jgi:acyl-coenzyme A thioesterase PaaI-like protein